MDKKEMDEMRTELITLLYFAQMITRVGANAAKLEPHKPTNKLIMLGVIATALGEGLPFSQDDFATLETAFERVYDDKAANDPKLAEALAVIWSSD